ncbi:hypothetical protein LSCM1_02342 [Leishmania martiniquensis]|uniref:Uncharacterized protein n=1 Tax=Leishmania martiniquensis TaxID=1580590 RepID=A0A836GIK9_9TRYP|nr:hypothetical protein LSCM1_02342 [Leishmania martiniquensis]
MGLLSGDSTTQRPPVGVPPYCAPPLAGLYRLRYKLPAPEGNSSDDHLGECGGEAAVGATADLVEEAGASSLKARHAAVHTQLLRASSLRDGDVDLFTLYSVCDVEPVPCLRCTLHMQATQKTCSYRLRQWYQPQKNGTDAFEHGSTADSDIDDDGHALSSSGSSPLIRTLQRGWYAFFFPMSECGRLKDSFLVCIGDALIAGDVAECDLGNDGCLRPLKKSATAAALKPTSAARRLWKSLFYYVVSPVPVHWGVRESADVHITISWRNTPSAASVQRQKNLTLLYSYYCSPRAPDVLTCHARFPSDKWLRRVRSPNCDTEVQLRCDVSEHTADVRVETADGKPLEAHRHTGDYVFALEFVFGHGQGLLEDTMNFVVAVVATVFLLILWFLLTKDLIL